MAMRLMWREALSPMFFQVCAAVGRFINAIAISEIGAEIGFAGAHINDIRIRSATAIAPMEEIGWLSKIGSHVTPPLVVFHTPPPTPPK